MQIWDWLATEEEWKKLAETFPALHKDLVIEISNCRKHALHTGEEFQIFKMLYLLFKLNPSANPSFGAEEWKQLFVEIAASLKCDPNIFGQEVIWALMFLNDILCNHRDILDIQQSHFEGMKLFFIYLLIIIGFIKTLSD